MPGFDVLDPTLPLMRRYFLEASAGTGKTFAIETLFVRLLLEEKELSLEEILVVTFTRAATYDLKNRIRKRLETMQGDKRAARALALFDEARIHTIHGFCFRALEENPLAGDLSFAERQEEEDPHRFRKVIKDHLRCTFSLHPKQWMLLLAHHGGEMEKVVSAIARLTEKRIPLEQGRSFDALEHAFQEALKKMALTPQEVLEHLSLRALCYEKMADKRKKLKREVEEGLKIFAALFSGEVFAFPFETPLLKMKQEKLLKRATLPSWGPWEAIQRNLIPLIEEASDSDAILAFLAEGARRRIEEVAREEELYCHEDLLQLMRRRVEDPLFAASVRGRFKAVFIDEFQDTDRVQWEIFSTLFGKEKFGGALYLIGDPKQSIYRFRMADLYTYYGAKEGFESDSIASLSVNYRATPSLVEALNALFTPIPDFLTLPKLKKSERCPPVSSPPGTRASVEKERRGSIHFFEGGTQEELFSFIVGEIQQLEREEGVSLSECAILVRDRIQGEEFCAFARQRGVQAVAKRNRSLADSPAFDVMEKLLALLSAPHDAVALKALLATPLFGWSATELLTGTEKMAPHFYCLKEKWEQEGILASLHALFATDSLLQELEATEGGLQLYGDMMQLAELLASPEWTLEIVQALPADAEVLQARNTACDEGIQVLTIHGSKGLEFDVVFPLGLIKGGACPRESVCDPEKRVLTLRPEAFTAHVEEVEAEKMRLLYVACTRARKRLYLPRLIQKKKPSSPLELFLEKLLENKPLSTFVSETPHLSLSDCTSFYDERGEGRQEELIAPLPSSFAFPPSFLSSFTSLAEAPEPLEKEIPSSLPSGKAFGSFLHHLLEKLSFRSSRETILSLVEKSPYSPWKEEIAEMIHGALKLSLKGFSLRDLDPDKVLRELEFLYPTGGGNLMKGFIDLVFEHEGTVYLLDWKSNLLEDYTEPTLEKAMERHNYFLQERIYREAVERYFTLCRGKVSYGGAFYLFVRGPGVYHVRTHV